MIPQLAAAIGPRFSRFPCYVQPKLNGVRCLCQIVNGVPVFASRDEKLWHPLTLQHLGEQLLPIKDLIGDRILDGELYKHGWKLQRINGAVAVKSHIPRHDTNEVEFHVFDVVDLTRAFRLRWAKAWFDIIKSDLSHIKAVETTVATNREDLEQHFHHYTSLGYEGVMLRPDGSYVYGRTPHGTRKNSPYLWKYKAWEDGEFVCIGVTHGTGKANIGIGALVLVTSYCKGKDVHEGPTFNVGTGFDDSERIALALNPPIGKLIKVRWVPPLTDEGIPTSASFLAVLD